MKQISLIILLPVLVLLGSCGEDSDTLPRTYGLGQVINYPSPSNYFNYLDLYHTAIGDINGDRLNDVVSMNNFTVFIYFQNMLGSLGIPAGLQTDMLLEGIAIEDVNNDGKMDLIICGNSRSALSCPLGRVVIYLQNTVTGELQSPQEYQVSSCLNDYIRNLVVTDLNSDGRNDIAIFTLSFEDPHISLFYQNIQGTLDPEIVIGRSIVHYYSTFQVADMNNDGRNDFVINNGLNGMAVLSQLASREFSTTPQLYSEPVGNIVLGDLNSDGRNDVLATVPGNTSWEYGMKIYLQNSEGTLNNPVDFDNPEAQNYDPVLGMKIADITGDGMNDIVLQFTGFVDVFPQRVEHTFPSGNRYSLFSHIFGGHSYENYLSIGDVTGDGLIDVVVPWSHEGLYVFPGITL